MLDKDSVFSLNFLAYHGIQTGDHHGMRYRMEKKGEKEEAVIEAAVWPEPFCYEKTPEESIFRKTFPFTEEGRIQAIDWMREEYDGKREIWDHVPTLLNAMI
ncbi:MAG: GNAT family acetyltransferase [Clostridiales bacterium]|nr:GNAT family acetyltransferase [Clostridiales bacterium]